ncbi:hypothetical protein CYLTODRAFT_450107 [Cylindrobasidium torrendii FP15055 ss-10]|uniref:Peptidase C14 caspase domain-containing protein n=1 Tax=Cylindrobasidium torrendii FP15055 ss-10 TaxID=1314674 RepID=A0A0D7BP31_9AGAR|nr:hypothetical protein CYLTODRAFT_450107 [Cylindrobasidium torrendii FP15055 ss-10]
MLLEYLRLLWKRVYKLIRAFLPRIKSPAKSDLEHSSGSRSFTALVIGINAYKSPLPGFPCLRGAVADANNISSFLSKSLGASSESITLLRDEEATRERILGELLALESDPRIGFGDPILVFYAGYGALVGEKDEQPALLPYDFAATNAQIQCAIGLSELRDLLSRISRAKGGNITVILDTCFPDAAMRHDVKGNDLDLLVRGMRLPYTWPTTTSEQQPSASFTLLQASSGNRFAYESGGCGHFTHALLNFLRNPSTPLDVLRYKDIIEGMQDLTQQFPHAEGTTDRRLFNGLAPDLQRKFYPVRKIDDGRLFLDAGANQRVGEGALVDVYAAENNSAKPYGTLIAGPPGESAVELHHVPSSPPFKVKQPSFGSLATLGHIPLVVSVMQPVKEGGLRESLSRVVEDLGFSRVRVVEESQVHELGWVESQGGQLRCEITDKVALDNGLLRLPSVVNPHDADIKRVIIGAEHFFKYLRQSRRQMGIGQRLTIECWELEEQVELTDEYLPLMLPMGDNLNRNGIVHVDVDEEMVYGFRIASEWHEPLYIWVFWFNMADLSIDVVYSPAREEPLQPFSELIIGYGHGGGTQPSHFVLPDDIDTDVTYMKVFATSHYVDLSFISQISPFDFSHLPPQVPDQRGKDWEALLIAIVQERSLPTHSREH